MIVAKPVLSSTEDKAAATGWGQAMRWLSHFTAERAEDLAKARSLFPNAARLLAGNTFISHSGVDTERIRNEIASIIPVVPGHDFFLHSRGSGGADSYRLLVLLALDLCARGILVVSAASAKNSWVAAEVDWLIEHGRPLAVCLLDQTSPGIIDPRIEAIAARCLDFEKEVRLSQSLLASGLIGQTDKTRAPPP